MLDNYLRDVLSSDYKPYRDDYRWEPVCNRQGKFDAKQCMGPRDKRRNNTHMHVRTNPPIHTT
ncbi:hypothetical protein E2C01_065154 [Portunus trituberculatus]|uniref:Uncharacterized protein n=1 Tax=Portunus trituberculatus TaxID=210409 RepID=A0A5B7HI38_PORTR|nr:hypothetical protein [Portunus trituberculatus]